jgi:cytoskeletal protein CcmA (bactofilin family)
MSGRDGQLSQGVSDQPSLNHSDSSDDFTVLPDTATYFDAWLESIQPQLTSAVDSVPTNHSLPTPERFSGPAPVPGEFRFEGGLRVDGYVTGLVRSQTGTLMVSETGEVDTDLFVPVAIVDGLVRGDIRATERVELGSTARVMGDIETPSLSVQPGAVFEGHCHFVPAARVINRPAPRSTDAPRLAMVRSRPIKPDREEAGPRVAAAGR